MLQLQPVDDKEVLAGRLLRSHLFLAQFDWAFWKNEESMTWPGSKPSLPTIFQSEDDSFATGSQILYEMLAKILIY